MVRIPETESPGTELFSLSKFCSKRQVFPGKIGPELTCFPTQIARVFVHMIPPGPEHPALPHDRQVWLKRPRTLSAHTLTLSGKVSKHVLTGSRQPNLEDLKRRMMSWRVAATTKYSCFSRSSLPSKNCKWGDHSHQRCSCHPQLAAKPPGDAPIHTGGLPNRPHRFSTSLGQTWMFLITASDGAAAVGTDEGLSIPNSCLQWGTELAASVLLLQSKRSSLPHC